MEIIESGLVGKKVKCLTCLCVVKLESMDKVNMAEEIYPPETNYFLECPSCKDLILLIKKISLPPLPSFMRQRRNHTKISHHNFVEEID